MPTLSSHRKAMLQALFVTLLWSSSWVLIKIGLKGMPPLIFAGLRYVLAFLLLLATVKKEDIGRFQRLTRLEWAELCALGAAMYLFTQGAQFWSLKYFPAVLPALLINLAPILIALLSFAVLGERIRAHHIVGIAICLVGAALYFLPKFSNGLELSWPLLIPIVGLCSNAAAALLGRKANRRHHLSPKVVTVVSMGFGSLLLLGAGCILEPFPKMNLEQWSIIAWLVIVNTAYAFTLWNHTLRTLSSVESSVINNTMMVQIAIFAWIFLGESLRPTEIVALLIVVAGVFIVQIRLRNKKFP